MVIIMTLSVLTDIFCSGLNVFTGVIKLTFKLPSLTRAWQFKCKFNKLCGRPPQYTPPLQVDL